MPNRLRFSTSPYLHQHAHNPVDWHPWDEEALNKAKTENKLIFLSIGYASCHWCHVMERESFEDEAVAELLNAHFVSIKVDREERPDIDAVYMEAVQLMTGSGGWPLNIWLTPELDPVFGGTYFPPESNYRLPSFQTVLARLVDIKQNDPAKLIRQSAALREALQHDILAVLREKSPHASGLKQAALKVSNQIDRKFGGFGDAPKFPNTMALRFILMASGQFNAADWFQLAHFSLKQLYLGGIYDQIGGGLCRYATDNRWLVPHFEKMLYDQALLISATVQLLNEKNDASIGFRLHQTLDFLERELKTADGLFSSAIDADSEGHEGLFYTWTYPGLAEVLTGDDDLEIASLYFGSSVQGNWEGTNILEIANRDLESESFSNPERAAQLSRIRSKLFNERVKRIRPITDTKSILSWNALLLRAFADVARWSGRAEDENRARSLANSLLEHHKTGDSWFRIFSGGKASIPPFLDDVSFTALAMLDIFELTGEPRFFEAAKDLGNLLMSAFYEGNGAFRFSAQTAGGPPFSTRDIFDNAFPGAFGSAIAAVQKLWRHTGESRFLQASEASFTLIEGFATENPLSFGYFLQHAIERASDQEEIIIIGPDWNKFAAELRRDKSTATIITGSEVETNDHPLFEGKIRPDENGTFAWVCRNFTCGLPVSAENLSS